MDLATPFLELSPQRQKMPHKAFSPGTALFRFIVPQRDDLIGVLKPAHGHCIDNIFGLPLLGGDAFAKSFGFAPR